jgi:hypothetical protein
MLRIGRLTATSILMLTAPTCSAASTPFRRNLPQNDYLPDWNIGEAFDKLVSTPPQDWEAGQWILAAVLLMLALWCCGFCCCACRRRRRYHEQPYYYGAPYPPYGYPRGGRRGTDSCCGCLRSILLCFCCYEYFCADCQDVPCFRHSRFHYSSENVEGMDYYQRQEGAIV